MWQIAIHTAFHVFFTGKLKFTAAFITVCIKRTITKQAVEPVIIGHCMTRKVFATRVVEKSVAVFQPHQLLTLYLALIFYHA